LIDKCNSFFRTARVGDLEDSFINFTRRVRRACNVTSRNVDISVDSDTQVTILSEDSLHPDRPRTVLRIFANKTLEWVGERFDRFNDTQPAKRFRFRIKRVCEFKPRNGSENDSDFQQNGFDMIKDQIVQCYDLTNETDTDVDPITDLGSVDIYSQTNGSTGGNGTNPPPNSTDTPSFRHVTRVGARFGPGRLARAILTFVATNVKNAISDGEVTLPGGVSFKLLLDNIPFRHENGTSIAVHINFDSNDNEGELVSNSTTTVESDPEDAADGYTLEDNTEGQVQFNNNDTRRIRWKRRVFCDGNKTLIVRMRFIKSVNETPSDGGFTVRNHLIVTFHIDGGRCPRLLWDPATDIETPEDNIVESTTTTTTATTTSSNTDTTTTSTGTTTTSTGTTTTSTGTTTTSTQASTTTSTSTTGSSNVAALVASFIMMIFALLF